MTETTIDATESGSKRKFITRKRVAIAAVVTLTAVAGAMLGRSELFSSTEDLGAVDPA